MTRDDDADGGKSRSQKKRESTAAQQLGAALAPLSAAELHALQLPAPLLKAIMDWKAFPGHEAKRRQMQYIGKLMRDMDRDALSEKLDAHMRRSRSDTEALHALETMRDALVNAEGAALEGQLAALAADYPEAPLGRLRHLAVTAKAERAEGKAPKAYRELFRLLRTLAARGPSA